MVVVQRRALLEAQIVPIAVIPIVLQHVTWAARCASTMRRTTVVLPEPEPPATPMVMGGTGKFYRIGVSAHPIHNQDSRSAVIGSIAAARRAGR